MAEGTPAETSPWAAHLAAVGSGTVEDTPGVTIETVADGDAVLVVARRGGAAELLRLVRGRGLDLPDPRRRLRSGSVEIAWAGPDRWLVRAFGPPGQLAALVATVAPVAVTIDQSHAGALLKLSGPLIRSLLAKGIGIDLHPRSFRTGDVAWTPLAGIPSQIWQETDAPLYGLAVPRSYAGSAAHWLRASGAEYGLCLRNEPGLSSVAAPA